MQPPYRSSLSSNNLLAKDILNDARFIELIQDGFNDLPLNQNSSRRPQSQHTDPSVKREHAKSVMAKRESKVDEDMLKRYNKGNTFMGRLSRIRCREYITNFIFGAQSKNPSAESAIQNYNCAVEKGRE